MAISVRPESAEDIGAIHSLTREAFRNAEHSSFTEQFITDALRNSGMLTISLVAVDQGRIVGHLAMSPVTLSDATGGWYGLGPVAVSPARQCEGIGSLLILRALDTLRQQGAQGCVVLGEPRYYSRFGFEPTASLILPGVPATYFQALAFVGQTPTAQVHYHDSFDSAGPVQG
jgi:predicted N-acetyltransferase YhbS